MTVHPFPRGSSGRPRPDTSRDTLRIRSEADILALVPYSLGFHPSDSLVLVAIGAQGRPFLARVDLPADPDDLPMLAGTLAVAAVRNDGRQALLVVYTDDAWLAGEAHDAMAAALQNAAMPLRVAIRADDGRWYPLGTAADARDDANVVEGVAYDVETHELTTRAVVEGRVTHGSRDALADTLIPGDWETVEAVEAAYALLGPPPSSRRALRAESRWARARIAAHRRHGRVPDAGDVARLLRAAHHPDLRDTLWCDLTREAAAEEGRAWQAVVRASPEAHVAPAAGMVALCAWLSGDGALAWCAVERSLQADPDQSLARLVADALHAAVPPSTWQPLGDTGALGRR
jgi:hypothetical protein